MNRSAVVFLGAWLGTWCAACGGSGAGTDATPTKPKIQVVTGHASAAPGSFEAVAFQCCDVPEAKSVVDRFVALGVTLAADDLEGSKAAAKAFADVLRVDGAKLAGKSETDAEMVGKLAALAGRMITHGALLDLREEYLDASSEVLSLAEAHKATEGSTYAVGFCPMKPGRWLQTAPPLANPYYGAEMLRCGTFEDLGDAD